MTKIEATSEIIPSQGFLAPRAKPTRIKQMTPRVAISKKISLRFITVLQLQWLSMSALFNYSIEERLSCQE